MLCPGLRIQHWPPIAHQFLRHQPRSPLECMEKEPCACAGIPQSQSRCKVPVLVRRGDSHVKFWLNVSPGSQDLHFYIMQCLHTSVTATQFAFVVPPVNTFTRPALRARVGSSLYGCKSLTPSELEAVRIETSVLVSLVSRLDAHDGPPASVHLCCTDELSTHCLSVVPCVCRSSTRLRLVHVCQHIS